MNNKYKIIIDLIVLSSVFVVSSCSYMHEDENHHKTIWIVNNSDKDVYTCAGLTYPDTFHINVGGTAQNPGKYKVKAHTKNKDAFWDTWDFWEENFMGEGYIQTDTLMIYIFDAGLFESNNIRESIVQRYDISLQDLQGLNWTVTYPPTPNMKFIKMWPPYNGY